MRNVKDKGMKVNRNKKNIIEISLNVPIYSLTRNKIPGEN